jgi:hypothetical protein
MLVGIDLLLDVLENVVLLVGVLREHPQVLLLLHLNHLNECFTDLPVLLCDDFISIESCNCSPFLLKQHVHFSNAVDRVGLLPDQLQIGLLLQTRG